MNKLDRVVVVGGSVAGLAAAATLAPLAAEVVVVERRSLPESGTVAPQGHLPHVMLAAGQRVLEDLFPGFAGSLHALGAVTGGPDPHRLPCHWVASGSLRDHLAFEGDRLPRALCSRALIERRLREVTFALPQVTVVEGSVDGLLVDQGRRSAMGVHLRGGDAIAADLVVDAGGRSTRVDSWLQAAGLPAPRTTEVVVDLRYTAYVVGRRPDDFEGGAFAVIQNSPDVPRIGVALPMEGDRWQVVLGGYFGEAAPTSQDGAGAFAATLTRPDLTFLFERPALAEPSRYTFRSSLRRHWERAEPVAGLCAIGDAVASFNPIYGQGMTSALLQAEALGSAVRAHAGTPRLERVIANDVARIVDNPWLTATGGDLVYDQTQGRRPPGHRLVSRYIERVMRVSAVDDRVNTALTAVQNLLAPPSTLFGPRIVVPVLRQDGPLAARTGHRSRGIPVTR